MARNDPDALCARCRHFTRTGVAPEWQTRVDGRCLGFNALIDDYKAWSDQCGMFDQAKTDGQEREQFIEQKMEARKHADPETALDQTP